MAQVSKRGLMRVLGKDQAIHEQGTTLLMVLIESAPLTLGIDALPRQ